MESRHFVMVIVLVVGCGLAAFAQPARIATDPDTMDIQLSRAGKSVPLVIQLVNKAGNVVPAIQETVLDLHLTKNIGEFWDDEDELVTQVTLKPGQKSVTVYFRPGRNAGSATLMIAPREEILFGAKVLFVLY